jgi:hypothetical protein
MIGEPTTVQTVRLSAELLVRLKIHCAIARKTQQEVLQTALVEYLDKHDKNAAQTIGGKKQREK